MRVFNAMQLKAGAKKEGGHVSSSLTQPIQFLPANKKNDDWSAWNLDWLELQGMEFLRRNARKLLKNYKLAKGIIDKKDYIIEEDNDHKDLMDVLTKEDESALELKFYPIIPNVINVLGGEFSKRFSKVQFRAVDDTSYNEMLESKRALVEENLLADASNKQLMKMLEMGLNPESEEAKEMMDPQKMKSLPQIEDFFSKSYRSMVEEWATHQMNVDVERFKMQELEERAFRDMLIADREFWHFRMLEDDYDVELWNPVLTFYQKSPETRYISDSNYAGKMDLMTVADVIDKYGYLMNEKQLKSLNKIYPARSAMYQVNGYQNDGAYYDATRSHAWNTNSPSLNFRRYISNWSDDPAILVSNALSPAEVQRVNVDLERKKLDVILTEENLSKAIGRRGQNVRLATKLLNYEINIMTDQEDSERRQQEFKEKTENFVKNLELDETLGQLLVAEGFSTIDDIKDSNTESLIKIEGIEEDTAKALIERAKEFHEKDQEDISQRIKDLGLEEALINLKGLTPGMLVTLGEQKILTLEDFADLASDELTGGYDVIKGERVKIQGYLEDFALSKDEADGLIMSARNIVYKD